MIKIIIFKFLVNKSHSLILKKITLNLMPISLISPWEQYRFELFLKYLTRVAIKSTGCSFISLTLKLLF